MTHRQIFLLLKCLFNRWLMHWNSWRLYSIESSDWCNKRRPAKQPIKLPVSYNNSHLIILKNLFENSKRQECTWHELTYLDVLRKLKCNLCSSSCPSHQNIPRHRNFFKAIVMTYVRWLHNLKIPQRLWCIDSQRLQNKGLVTLSQVGCG